MSALLLTLAVTAAPAVHAPLPLRNDDVLGGALLFKVALFTALLLLGTWLVLRLYAKHIRTASTESVDQPQLLCESALRLSSRTRVYLVRAGGAQVLVTESSAGSQSVVLPPPDRPSGEAAS